jgi:hypothetical protein
VAEGVGTLERILAAFRGGEFDEIPLLVQQGLSR